MKRIRNTGIAITTLALIVTLSACSGDNTQTSTEPGSGSPSSETTEAEKSPSLFEFAAPTFGPSEEVTARVPQDLLDAAGLQESDLLVTSVTLKPHELDSAQACAVDLTHVYSDGVIGKPIDPEFLKNQEGTGTTYGDSEAEVLAFYLGRETRTYADGGMATLSIQYIDQLDSSDPEHGYYFSPDLQTVTIVTDCAPSPLDESNLNTADNSFYFTRFSDSPLAPHGVNRVAGFAFNIMRDGTVTLLDANAADFVRDSNGYWIAN